MLLYTQIMFGLYVFLFVVEVLIMYATDYPEIRQPKTLAQAVAGCLLHLAMLIWTGLILFY